MYDPFNESLEDWLLSDEIIDPHERTLPDAEFMERTFGPVKPSPSSNPPPLRSDDFSVEVDGY